MQISIAHPRPTEVKDIATTWLLKLLDAPSLTGYSKPAEIRGYIYIDGLPKLLQDGSWEIGSDSVYLARASVRPIESLTKVGILAGIANLTGAIENPAVIKAISERITKSVAESVMSIYGGIVSLPDKPSKFAIDPTTCRAAIMRENTWFLPGGSPVEVNESWITMDF